MAKLMNICEIRFFYFLAMNSWLNKLEFRITQNHRTLQVPENKANHIQKFAGDKTLKKKLAKLQVQRKL